MKIWAHTIVNNEENFIWFSLMSVVDFVDQILIYDTGSTDKTVEIIKEIQKIKGNKIILKQVGLTGGNEFPKLRQKMLEESRCDWILVLDGDEIWWENSIKKVIKEINDKGDVTSGIVVPMVVPVGDIYHLQEEKAGQYELLGKKGHYNLRAISMKIPGLHVDWPYGKESYFDKGNNLIQNREKITFLDAPYLHVTHLRRSSVNKFYNKVKYEIGDKVTKEFKYPEVFYKKYPGIVPLPWIKISGFARIKAKILTPLRKIKRRIS